MSDIERYHKEIVGTHLIKHSANQHVVKQVKDGENLHQRGEERRMAGRNSLVSQVDPYEQQKLERIMGRVARVLAGERVDDINPEVFAAEIKFIRQHLGQPSSEDNSQN